MLKAPPPPVDMESWKRLPHLQRIRPLALRFVEFGAESPRVVHVFYLLKLAGYILGGLAIIAATPGMGGLSQLSTWWHEPIAYQKVIIFTCLIEGLGLGGSSGPLAFKFLPPVTGFLHWLRPGTIRQPPWPRVVPLTRGDRRSTVDVAITAAVFGLMVALLASPGVGTPPPGASVGLLPTSLVVPLVVLMGIMGLRDKVFFFAARGDLYWIASLMFLFPYDQMMIGLKLALVFVWVGAAISKFTPAFPYVVCVMMSNAPLRPKWFKRMLYRDFPSDVRPSKAAFALAHTGTVIEIVVPLTMLFSHGGLVSLVAVAIMVIFHLNIISFVPLAVPNEWNVFMIYGSIFLFWGHADIAVSDLSHPLLILVILTALVAPVVLGNLRPDLVSFIPSMRYYAGNWAVGLWCFRRGSERKLRQHISTAGGTMEEQIERIYDADAALVNTFRLRAWRSMHPQGRALNGLLTRAVDDVEEYTVLDGEPLTGTLMGWDMGDGHMHNEQLLAAVQKRCRFQEGELVLVFLESQPIHVQRQRYRIVDAATGEVEAGYVRVRDMLARQPWDDSPFPVEVIGGSTAPATGPRARRHSETR